MDKKCAICCKTRDLFELELESDGEKYSRFVCGSCWDVIAGIAMRAIKAMTLRLQEAQED